MSFTDGIRCVVDDYTLETLVHITSGGEEFLLGTVPLSEKAMDDDELFKWAYQRMRMLVIPIPPLIINWESGSMIFRPEAYIKITSES